MSSQPRHRRQARRGSRFRTAVLGGLVLSGLWTGCRSSHRSDEPSDAQSVSSDGRLRYSLDPTRGTLEMRRLEDGRRLAEVRVGKAPARLAVSDDGRLYVSDRASRRVLVLDARNLREVGSLEVGVEPVGLALSRDDRTLYVVNSSSVEHADQGTLMAVDVATGKPRWTVPVGREPREVRLLSTGRSEDRARVSRYLRADAVEVDLHTQRIHPVPADLHAER